MKHTLIAKGAPHNEADKKLGSGTAGVGRAKCSCGELSEEFNSGKQRVAWHKEHKAEAEAAQPGSKKFDIVKMKDKISKLLAKAEGTDNEDEQRAFTEKAELLMLELGIHSAELEAAGEVKSEKIVQKHRDFPGNYSIVMVPFAWEVAAGLGNLTVLNASFRDSLKRRIFVIGHESDVNTFLQLLDSLTLQVRTALRVWQKENAEARRGLTDMEKYIQHRSFISGYGHTVRDRLTKIRESAVQEASTGAELVLVGKQAKVDEWVENKYPDLKAKDSNMRWSLAGAMAGREAGAKADIGQKSAEAKKQKKVDA